MHADLLIGLIKHLEKDANRKAFPMLDNLKAHRADKVGNG